MSEIIAIIVKCDGCEHVVVANNATFEVTTEALCDSCNGVEEAYTCFCNGGVGDKTLEFQCSSCKKYSSISVK